MDVIHLDTDHVPEPDQVLGHDGERVGLISLLQTQEQNTITQILGHDGERVGLISLLQTHKIG